MQIPGEVAYPERLRTQTIHYTSGSASIDAYLAEPPEKGPAPGIIVIHEAFGLVDHTRDICRRFANIGFQALAPNLYAEAGPPDPDDLDSVLAKMFALPDGKAVLNLEDAAATLRDLDGASGKVGAIGFCSGGRHTLLLACTSTAIDAAVDCWGGNITQASPDATTTEARPTPVIDLVPQLSCPLYAVFGIEDQNPSPDVARELEERLSLTSQQFRAETFANAGHAFLADYRPSYREEAAFALWPKVTSFFEEHLR